MNKNKAKLIFCLKLFKDAVLCMATVTVSSAVIFGAVWVLHWIHKYWHVFWYDLIMYSGLLTVVIPLMVWAAWSWFIEDYLKGLWRDAEKQAEFESCKTDQEHSLLRASQPEE